MSLCVCGCGVHVCVHACIEEICYVFVSVHIMAFTVSSRACWHHKVTTTQSWLRSVYNMELQWNCSCVLTHMLTLPLWDILLTLLVDNYTTILTLR